MRSMSMRASSAACACCASSRACNQLALHVYHCIRKITHLKRHESKSGHDGQAEHMPSCPSAEMQPRELSKASTRWQLAAAAPVAPLAHLRMAQGQRGTGTAGEEMSSALPPPVAQSSAAPPASRTLGPAPALAGPPPPPAGAMAPVGPSAPAVPPPGVGAPPGPFHSPLPPVGTPIIRSGLVERAEDPDIIRARQRSGN